MIQKLRGPYSYRKPNFGSNHLNQAACNHLQLHFQSSDALWSYRQYTPKMDINTRWMKSNKSFKKEMPGMKSQETVIMRIKFIIARLSDHS